MHMSMWFGYDVGELLFQGIHVTSKGVFAVAWIVLFIVSFLFEGSKVIVARTQRAASRKLYPHKRYDDSIWQRRRSREAGTSQTVPLTHNVISAKYRILINLHQTVLYLLHNTLGYILMLVVMLYNVYLILAVVLGMVLGYFTFGPMLTKLQMECFVKASPYCTPECDENAEGTTPPLLHSSLSSESDFFICQTQNCAAARRAQQHSESPANTTSNCYFGAKRCASKVAVARKILNEAGPSHCLQDTESDKDMESQNIEDTKLLSENTNCCKNSSSPDPVVLEPMVRIVSTEQSCCSSKSQNSKDTDVGQSSQREMEEASGERSQRSQVENPGEVPYAEHDTREQSPQISCCHNTKTLSESQECIM